MTEEGRQFILARLADCPDLASLRRVWDSLSDEYKRDPAIQRAKDEHKRALDG